MMKKIAQLLPVLSLFFLVGCMSVHFVPVHEKPLQPKPQSQAPSQSQPQSQSASDSYGPPPPQNYKEMIQSDLTQSFITNILFGSRDSTYEFNLPVKTHTEDSHVLGTERTFGWAVCGNLYRKERLAGYATYDGPIPFYVLFKDGKIAERLVGQTTYDHTVGHSLNDDIKQVCERKQK